MVKFMLTFGLYLYIFGVQLSCLCFVICNFSLIALRILMSYSTFYSVLGGLTIKKLLILISDTEIDVI